MRKKLKDVAGGRSLVLDHALLEIIGAGEADELELTTDGRRLILAPIGFSPETPVVATGFDCEDPKDTVRVVRDLEPLGLNQEHFRRLHHSGPKASILGHVRYCQGTGRFTASNNVIVCRRLVRCLELRRRGVSWNEAIETAVREYPFPKT